MLSACQINSPPSAEQSVCRISDRIIAARLHLPSSETLNETETIYPYLDGLRHQDLYVAATLLVDQAATVRLNAFGARGSNEDFLAFADAASAFTNAASGLSHLCVQYRYSSVSSPS